MYTHWKKLHSPSCSVEIHNADESLGNSSAFLLMNPLIVSPVRKRRSIDTLSRGYSANISGVQRYSSSQDNARGSIRQVRTRPYLT